MDFYTASTYQYEDGKIIPLEDSFSMDMQDLCLWLLNTLLRCPKANHVKIFNDDHEIICSLDQENIFEWYYSTKEYDYPRKGNKDD